MKLNDFLEFCVPDDLIIQIIVDMPETDFIGFKDEYLKEYSQADDYRWLFLKSVDVNSDTLVIFAEV